MGILQVRILEWVAMSSSRGSSQSTDQTQVALEANSLPSEPPGRPMNTGVGSLSLRQGIFPIQESNRVSCIAGAFFYQPSYQGSPMYTCRHYLFLLCVKCIIWWVLTYVYSIEIMNTTVILQSFFVLIFNLSPHPHSCPRQLLIHLQSL